MHTKNICEFCFKEFTEHKKSNFLCASCTELFATGRLDQYGDSIPATLLILSRDAEYLLGCMEDRDVKMYNDLINCVWYTDRSRTIYIPFWQAPELARKYLEKFDRTQYHQEYYFVVNCLKRYNHRDGFYTA